MTADEWEDRIAAAYPGGVPRDEWVAIVRVLREDDLRFAEVRGIVKRMAAPGEYDGIYDDVLSVDANCHPTEEHVAEVRVRLDGAAG